MLTPNTKTHEFAYAVGEPVEITLQGIVIERTNGEEGDKYWVEQTLPNGRTARQWFKERDVYEADAAEPRRAAA